MKVSLQLDKERKQHSVTAFPKVPQEFLQEDIYAYKEDTDTLTEKIFVLEHVDFPCLHMVNLSPK